MKRYGKNRRKNYLFRYLFIMEDGIIVSVRLKTKRVRHKFIDKYCRGRLRC